MPWKPLLPALAAWHLICFAAMTAWRPMAEQIAQGLETRGIEIQANYGHYERIAVYIGLATVTSVASACVFPIFDRLVRQRPPLRNKLTGFVGLEVAVWLTLIWSYESGFPYKLHAWDLAIFGLPAEIYSFRNLVLHRLIAWQLSTTPIVVVALWFYSKLNSRLPAAASAAGQPATY